MAETYSTTSQDLKEEGWGTTNIVLISNEGSGAIIVGVDSRSTSPNNKGFILNEDAKKIYYMESCNVLATMAGNSIDCMNLLCSVDNVIGRACGDVVNNGVHCAPKIVVKDGILRAPEMARSYIADWFEKCGRLIGRSTQYDFEGCLIMAGWDAKDAPYVCDVQRYGLTYVTRSKECVGFVNGSGRERVMEYFRACRLENKVQSSIELSQNVIRGLLCAALFDENSGGNLCVFEVKKKNVEVVYDRSVLGALSEYYNDLVSYLFHSLFLIVETQRYPYTHENNVRLNDRFREKLPRYRENVVVRRGENYVVRLAHFDNADDQLYQQLRTENRERNVTPETEAVMEEFGLEQFQQDAIWFGLPTWKLVQALDLWKL